MSYRLNLLHPPKTPIKKPVAKAPLYTCPIGWWSVSTDGDVEGRTTRELGQFYGHIAEIAFSLADKVFYSIRFSPVADECIRSVPKERPQYQAKKSAVWVSLGIQSGTWEMNPERRAEWMAFFLNCRDEVSVESHERGAVYYAASYLILREND
jgi:hypothetical protein